MPKPLVFSCQHCGSILSVPAKLAGAEAPCPACGATITAPASPSGLPGPPPDQDLEEDLPYPPIEPPAAAPNAQEESPNPPEEPADTVEETPAPPEEPPESLDPWDSPIAKSASGSTEPMAVPNSLSREPLGLARWISFLVLLACLGGAVWLAGDFHTQKPAPKPTSPPAILPVTPEATSESEKSVPATPNPMAVAAPAGEPTPPSPETTPTKLPTAPALPQPPPPEPPPVAAVSEPPAPTPPEESPARPDKAPPRPQPPPEIPPPEPSPPASAPIVPIADTPLPTDFKGAADAFLRASTPQARLPLLFSTRWSPGQLAEQLLDGRLSSLPSMEYKTVVHVSKSADGVQHFYVAVKTTDVDPTSANRELLLHLANHGGAGFRINADALAFHLENPLPGFLDKPTDDPLAAWVFIERGRFKGEADAGNRLCLNLRMGPLTPVVAQVLIEADSPLIPAINPWVGWSTPPKPVFLELRHSKLDTITVLTPGQQITADWLPPSAP